jgi:hypothetical protein
MKPHFNGRITRVLQHAQSSCVSLSSEYSLALRFILSLIATRCSHGCYRPLHPHGTDSNNSFATPPSPLNCIQIP